MSEPDGNIQEASPRGRPVSTTVLTNTELNDAEEETPKRGRPSTEQALKTLREQVQTLEQQVAILAETVQGYAGDPFDASPGPKPNNGVVPGLDALQAALRDDPKFRKDVLLKAELIDQKLGGHLQQFVMALARGH